VSIINVEGNIAAGKSTVLRILAERGIDGPTDLRDLLFTYDRTSYTDTCIVPEAVEEWTNVGVDGTDLLAAMYAEPKANALACQINILMSQARALINAIIQQVKSKRSVSTITGTPACVMSKNRECATTYADTFDRRVLVVTERSLLSSREIFTRSMLDKGYITSAEWAVYMHCYDATRAMVRGELRAALGGDFELCDIGTLMLVTPPEQALQRAKKRDRPAERLLELPVLDEIAKRHTRLFFCANEFVRCPVVAVDANLLMAVLKRKVHSRMLMCTVYGRAKSSEMVRAKQTVSLSARRTEFIE